MKDLSRFFEHREVSLRTCPNEFKYYKPDFSEEKELYRVDNQPINIINNSENVPFLQNVAQQTLVDVSSSSIPTDGMSDKQLAELATPRFLEVDEISDAANRQLHNMYDEFKKSQNDSES